MNGRTKQEPDPPHMLRLKAGGHFLTGVKLDGKWQFTCDSWPALAEKHSGTERKDEMIQEFLDRALPINGKEEADGTMVAPTKRPA